MIKAIVFDCFGVLVTEGWNSLRDTYFPEGTARQAAMDLRQAADRGLISNDEFESQVAERAGISLELVRSYIRDNAPNEPLFKYIQDELQARFRIGMLSNAAADWMEELFTPQQRALFAAIVLSFEIGAAKPDPRAYQVICQRLDVSPQEAVFVDDNERFCASARDLGMQAILYQDFSQCKADLGRLVEEDSAN